VIGLKTGKVDSIEDVRGLREWRFVPKNWTDPFLPHMWCMWCKITDEKLIEQWREKLADCPIQTWYGADGKPSYTAEVSYHPDLRPVLVVIGGIL